MDHRAALRLVAAGFLATVAGSFVAGTVALAVAQTMPCSSLDLQIAIVPTEPPECSGGSASDGDAQGEWEYIEMYVNDLFIGVVKERAGLRSVFYRPTLEGYVPNILRDDADNIEWGDEIEDERFDVRRFDLIIDTRTTVVCVVFLDTGARIAGSEVKTVLYGIFCNLDGSVFFDADVTELLAKIGR